LPPGSGAKTPVITGGGQNIEAVAIYERSARPLFTSRLDEPNGSVQIGTSTAADVTVLDFPLLASLVFQNTPTGRLVDDDVKSFEIWEELPPDVTSFTGPNVVKDDFGQVFVKRRKIGAVPIAVDGSARFEMPGGVPFVLHLPDTKTSGAKQLPRWQRETMSFAPGEVGRQAFRRDFFNGFCGQCHGAISGRPLDVAMSPDMLTQASTVAARGQLPTPLNLAPGMRDQPQGPPSTP